MCLYSIILVNSFTISKWNLLKHYVPARWSWLYVYGVKLLATRYLCIARGTNDCSAYREFAGNCAEARCCLY